MINSVEIGYLFSKYELIFLASLLGNNELFGIDENENLSSLSKEETAEKWEKIKPLLEKKGYISAEENEIKIDKIIAELINACCRSTAVISFLYDHSEETKMYICISEDILVLMELKDKDTFIITPIQNIRSLTDKISDIIDYMPTGADKSDEEIRFNKFDYYSFMAANNLKDIKKSSDMLIAKGMDPKNAETVSKAFVTKDNFVSMVSYSQSDNYESIGETIILIPADNQIYSVESYLSEDEIMVIRSISKEEYESVIENLISKAAKIINGGNMASEK